MKKPILCIDFDGVIHSYTSWRKGADVVSDPPTAGAMRFIWDAAAHFAISILSSRSGQPGGKRAMRKWLTQNFREYWAVDRTTADDILAEIDWPDQKPPAMVTIDDRAICFDGIWPTVEDLLRFRPWNKRELGATGKFPMPALSDDDEGELRMAVGFDKLSGLVRLEFGKPTAWLALPPADARALAMTILKHASPDGVLSIEI